MCFGGIRYKLDCLVVWLYSVVESFGWPTPVRVIERAVTLFVVLPAGLLAGMPIFVMSCPLPGQLLY